MTAYTPEPANAAAFVILLLITAAGVFVIDRRGTPALAWVLVVAAVASAVTLTINQPSGFRMVAIVVVLLTAMKAVMLTEARLAGRQPLPIGRWLGFVLAWPGMRPEMFASRKSGISPGAGKIVLRGGLCLFAGCGLVMVAHVVWVTSGSLLLATAVLLPGISLALHFGLMAIVVGGWRLLGVDARPLFRSPLRSTSLREFWGRRWNLAFSEMTATAVYRPLKARAGQPGALVASFAFSGLLHETAVSLPVLAGFGLPLIYFTIHGVLMLIERELARRGHPLGGWFGRSWTVTWLVLPLPLLFHPWFLAGTVWPLLGTR